MSRLAPLDKALVWILVPLWVVCFAVSVRTQLLGGGIATLKVSVKDAESYPTLTGDTMLGPKRLAATGLRVGDRLIQLGDADLRGVGSLGLHALRVGEGRGQAEVPLIFERDGERRETAYSLMALSSFLSVLAVSLAFAASALWLILRGGSTPTLRAYFHAGMCIALSIASPIGSGVAYAGAVALNGLWLVSITLLFPLWIRFAFRFPNDIRPEGRWNLIWPWFFVLHGLFAALRLSSWASIGVPGMTITTLLGVGALLAVSWRTGRRTDRVGRRQMRWLLFGTYWAVLLPAVTIVLATLDPRFAPFFFTGFWATATFPLFLVISVARFNLFDIDRVLSATASYNILLVLLGAGALVVVPRLAETASGFVGIDPGTSQVVLSLALAGVVIPAHRRLRPQIDRLFFKERYALDQGIAELLPILSACANTRELTERAGAGLQRLLRPEACVVYAAVEESYAPVFAEGRAVPPAFAGGSPLIAALQERRVPLALDDAGRRPDEAPLGPFDRAALETLQAEVVVPVRQDDALAAFVCLGPKRSGDVYTSTDLSLLSTVAEKVSTELRRFDQDEVIREGRAMQESLRRYVPGAIAEQLSSGAELASGEREISVLFVDIRGYTSFSESRRADEIFSTVNRYTETVSQIVQKHAGSVVEFNGDGMMAVFGAPRELAHKERAAVQSGYEIVEAVGALPVEDTSGGEEKLSVGVGIATGEAFVGNIQAVDRMIWTAIGNTTNLAARLQSLTRELDAALVIDHSTWERAQPAAGAFEKRSDVPIRGRREIQDVYALPLRSGS